MYVRKWTELMYIRIPNGFNTTDLSPKGKSSALLFIDLKEVKGGKV